ncbi:MAG TPA: tetratricopeptide repeat protein [Meiothermus sp.]|nr:tetratricopeptide repeat protein [Meiothermus sp.]
MKVPLAETLTSILALIETDRIGLALQTLRKLVDEARTYHACQILLEEVFSQLSEDFLAIPEAAHLYARVLCSARKPHKLLEFAQGYSVEASSPVNLYRAWAMIHTRQPERALELLAGLEQTLLPSDQGLWLRFKAEALAFLGAEGWKEAFAEARQHLAGGALGRCLTEEGNHRFRFGELASARGLWSEALSYLNHDPYYSAWLRHSLGITALAQDPVEAEYHLLIAEELSRKQAAREFRARALCGLGAVRRVLREWDRAISSYQAAYKAAQEPDDMQEALWGLGNTYRLSGRPAEAVHYFFQAHAVVPSSALFVDIAAAKLMLGDLQGAEVALTQVSHLNPREEAKATLLRAEIARRKGHRDGLGQALSRLEPSSAWVAEEHSCFPDLFESWRQLGRLGVFDPPRPQVTRVEVKAAGILQVKVNGREVPLKPTSKAAEVLVLLLEGGGQETVERLVVALNPDTTPEHKEKDRQKVWAHVKKLRQVLGWEGSVEAMGGAYRLDPSAKWDYDMRHPQVRARGQFLEGIYSGWVLDKREQLGLEEIA